MCVHAQIVRECFSQKTQQTFHWIKAQYSLGHFGFLMPLSQQVKTGIIVLGGVTDPDFPWECGLFFHNAGKEDYVSLFRRPFRTTWCYHVLWVRTMGSYNNPIQADDIWPRAFRDEGFGHFSRERTGPAEGLAEGGGNKEWGVEEGSYKYQLKSRD